MESLDIGIIHRDLEEEDFSVAELQMAATGETTRPELTMFNPFVSDQWVFKRPCVVPVRRRDGLDTKRVLGKDDPHEVSFILKHESSEQEDGTFDNAQIWLVSIDMIKKKLKSSILYVEDQEDSAPEEAELFERKDWFLEPFLPIEIPKDPSLYDNR
ncbi:hypothetical protein BAE44_0009504 [Dichanthelium oligosanthes]|uniref:DUF1618 domain-containing protein n=1 Tax=Dichanthelium oligosanthes TaxID=888268 RepID=A0A1E5VWI2_9POAL|nr:hypothetical protein BAE44_0009504 [Dichanthelium oligosanthes]